MNIKEEEIDSEIWAKFTSSRSKLHRDALIVRYNSYANMLAAKFYANRHINEIEFDEFKQYAIVGLIEAIDRYDPKYGVSFQAYSSHRIKGAILNGIEKYCEKQQQISLLSRLREERMRSLLQKAVDSKLNPFEQLFDVAIGTAIGFMLEESGMYSTGNEEHQQNVYHGRELEDLKRVMDELISKLVEQEQKVIRLHYLEHIRFDEIAKQMKVSKGRVSQIHHKALKSMHEHYDQLKLLRIEY